jgi:hypothetical protein
MTSAFLTFLTVAAWQAAVAWFFGRRLAAHARRNPQAAVAWWEHVVKPALTRGEPGPKAILGWSG